MSSLASSQFYLRITVRRRESRNSFVAGDRGVVSKYRETSSFKSPYHRPRVRNDQGSFKQRHNYHAPLSFSFEERDAAESSR